MLKKSRSKYIILIPLIQSLKKLKTKFKVSNINKINLLLVEFLWMNSYIYGFKQQIGSKNIYIFLKYSKSGNFLITTKLNKNINFLKLKKEIAWSKNSFFIIKTSFGLLNIKSMLTYRIGGFILYKFF